MKTRSRLRAAYRAAAVAGLSVTVAGIAAAAHRHSAVDGLVAGYTRGSGKGQIMIDARLPNADTRVTALLRELGLRIRT